MMAALAQRMFHLVCTKELPQTTSRYEDDFRASGPSMADFIERFAGNLDFQGKTILDVGCGLGLPALLMARGGARRVVGVDITARNVDFARRKLAGDFRDVADRVEFRTIADFADLEDERFDLIVSKDSFEHYADPEGFVPAMSRLLTPGGQLAIGFGPLWKSPYGGHISYMTRLPWAHLLFPERVVLRERERFFPDQRVQSFGEIVGGLNKMTLGRFRAIIAANRLDEVYFQVNASKHRLGPVFSALARLPLAREYCSFNLYGIWQPRPRS